MNELTIVMPIYIINEQTLQITKNAIENIEQTAPDAPLIIIDNGCQLGGGYLRSKSKYIYLRNTYNLGFAKAVNQGIALSKTKVVTVFSTDTRISKGWVDKTIRIFDENPNAFSVHYRMVNYDEQMTTGDSVVITGKERWCTAALFSLNKTKGLLFDEEFFNSYDDWDLFTRARYAKFNTIYTDQVTFQHNHSFTQKFLGFPGTEKNKEFFKQKHGEYADILFAREFPEQMKVDYAKGFDL